MDQQFFQDLDGINETKGAKETLFSKEQISKYGLLISGYIRDHNANSKIFIYDNIRDLIKTYSKFYETPHNDPINFISTKDIQNGEKYRLSGNHLFKQKQYQDALIKYHTALKYNPNDYRIYCNSSLCHLLSNQLEYANCDALFSFRCCPTNIKCWYRFGSIAYKLNDIKTAYLAFRTAKNISNIMNIENKAIQKQFNMIKTKMTKDNFKYIKYFDKKKFHKCYILFLQNTAQMFYYSEEQKTMYYDVFREICVELYRFMKWSESVKFIKNKSAINDIDLSVNKIWVVSYASDGAIGYNKRVFMIQIAQSNTNIVDAVHEVFGQPNATQVIDAILHTMLCGFRECISSKPVMLFLAYRLKDMSNKIMDTMMEYGIHCTLEDEMSAILTAKMHGTDVNGYNFYQNLERMQEIKQQMSLKEEH